MANFTAYDQVGKKEDIADLITNISPTKTPFTAMTGSEGIHNIVHQWQEDALALLPLMHRSKARTP
jgi:tetrahydromethanopterin S-methyltransferase subunit B